MKLFFDLLPIIAFFIAYKFFNIYVATAAAVAVSALALLVHWIRHRRLDKLLLATTLLVLVLGGTTLWLHNPIFIQWKPTAVCWLFALVFLGSQWIGDKPLIQRMMGVAMERQGEKAPRIPSEIWYRLNRLWILFYIFLGAMNLFVVYHFDTNTWVNFKLFGMLGLMFVFVLLQSVYLSKQLTAGKSEPRRAANDPETTPEDNR